MKINLTEFRQKADYMREIGKSGIAADYDTLIKRIEYLEESMFQMHMQLNEISKEVRKNVYE